MKGTRSQLRSSQLPVTFKILFTCCFQPLRSQVRVLLNEQTETTSLRFALIAKWIHRKEVS